MQIDNRNDLKNYFQSNKRPTEAQFADLIDSVVLVTEIPPTEDKPFATASFLLSCDGSRPDKPKIGYVILENSLTELSIGMNLNRISLSSTDIAYEFNLDRIFINIGALNDTCSFDKVTFSLNESTSTELILYCETIDSKAEEPETSNPETSGQGVSDDQIITGPGIELPGAVSFKQLAIEIRIYDELLNLIESDPNLTRYREYLETKDLRKEDNLLIPPYRFVSSDGRRNNKNNGSNTDQDLAIWKQMPDKYLILPEINTDQEKNPQVYNLKTKEFGCYYTFAKIWGASTPGSSANFLKNSVKKARKAGATECTVNLGDNAVFIKNNIDNLKIPLLSGNDRGMNKISLVVNNVITHYTKEEILAL